MKLKTLLHDLNLASEWPQNPEITGIAYDSRRVKAGDMYVCLPGVKTHGHSFIPQALEQGAAAVIYEAAWLESQFPVATDCPFIPVADTAVALAVLAATFYDYPARQLTMIAVTGTNGKTTTTHLIEAILAAQRVPTAIMGTLYYKIGEIEEKADYTTPFSPEIHAFLRRVVNQGGKAAVMETSSHALHQHRLAALDFDVAVFTNLTQDHLDYHESMESYRDAKGILFAENLKSTGTAVLNLDDPASTVYARQSRGRILTYAIQHTADLMARNITYEQAGVAFTVEYLGKSYPLRLRLPGHYNIYNALAALGVALSLEIPLLLAIQTLAAVPGVAGRLEVVTPQNHPFTVVVDYAHTPDSLDNVLRAARQFTKNRLIAVFGCGGDRDRTKRPKMGNIAVSHSDVAVVTSDNPRTEEPSAIIDDILAGIENPQQVVVEPDRRKAIRHAIGLAQPGDVVVIAGKGHENYQIFKTGTIHFDDREEARAAFI